eukprot:2425679-Prymnesium_polylepis.1
MVRATHDGHDPRVGGVGVRDAAVVGVLRGGVVVEREVAHLLAAAARPRTAHRAEAGAREGSGARGVLGRSGRHDREAVVDKVGETRLVATRARRGRPAVAAWGGGGGACTVREEVARAAARQRGQQAATRAAGGGRLRRGGRTASCGRWRPPCRSRPRARRRRTR